MKKTFLTILICFFYYSYSEAETKSDLILQKIEAAKTVLAEAELAIESKKETVTYKSKVRSKKTKKWVWVSSKRTEEIITGREVALIAWDPVVDKFHQIRIMTPYLYNVPFSFRVLTSGYEVEHVSGRGASKLVMTARKDDRKLLVLAYKHWWIAPGYSKNDDPKVFEKYADVVIYSPYAPDLYDEETILKGAGFLFNEISLAKVELYNKQVPSKAYPGKLLYEVIPDDYIFNLGHNEQMDHAKFEANSTLTAEEISIEYALNGKDAFRWIASWANARGPFQFTNIARGKNIGTYDYVVRDCVGADLIKDFGAGTQDLRNMIKSAICLLDLELSKMPQDVKDQYLRDYRVGSIYPSICYNGGCGKAFQLYNWLRRNKKELNSDFFDFPISSIGHPETHTYIRKQAFLWSYADQIKEKLRSYKIGQP